MPPLVVLLGARSQAVQEQAAQALCQLAYGSPSNRAAIAAAGSIPPLVGLLGSSSKPVQLQALYALGMQALGSQPSITKAGGVAQLQALQDSGTPLMQKHAASLLSFLGAFGCEGMLWLPSWVASGSFCGVWC